MNKIIVYEGNSVIVECTVYNPDGIDADLTDFDATLTVKQNKYDTTALITETGVIVDNVITFTLPYSDNELDYGSYYYEVTIELDDQKLTVVQDRMIVKESIVYVS